MEEVKVNGLYGKYYQGNEHTVIIMHGLLSSMGEFFDYPEKINSAGYSVLIFDFSGHGRSEGIRGYESIEKNIDDLKKIVDFARSRNDGKIVLLGHSLGAATVIYALARGMGDLGIAIAPPGRIKDELSSGERMMLPLIYAIGRFYEITSKKRFYIKYRVNYQNLFKSRETVEKAEKMGFLGNKIWIGSYKPLMEMDAFKEAGRVKKPCMIVIPTEDKVVNPEHGKAIYHNLGDGKEMYLARGYNHSLMGEDSGEIMEKILDFIRRNLNPI